MERIQVGDIVNESNLWTWEVISINDSLCYLKLIKSSSIKAHPYVNSSNVLVHYNGDPWGIEMTLIQHHWTKESKVVQKSNPCECGAHHTSMPNIHSDWCPAYRPYK